MKSGNEIEATLAVVNQSNQAALLTAKNKDALHVAFPKSPSKNFNLVMAMLTGELTPSIVNLNKKNMYLVSFDLMNPFQCNVANNIISLTSGWKGTFIAHKGKILSSAYYLTHTLSCIARAGECDNHLAYCLKQIRNHIIPCRNLYNYSIKINLDIPASPKDQIQALAVESDVAWCPYFNIDNFKIIEAAPNQQSHEETSDTDSFKRSTLLRFIASLVSKKD